MALRPPPAAAFAALLLLAQPGLAFRAPASTTSRALFSRPAQARTAVAADLGRTVRQFVYGGFAVAGGVGALSAGSDLAGALGGDAGAPPVQTAAAYLAVDLLVVGACAAGWKIDSDSNARAPARPGPAADLPETLPAVSGLALSVVVALGADDEEAGPERREVPAGELQAKAGQTLVAIAGTRAAVSEALLSALVSGREMAAADVLLVPVVVEEGKEPAPKGFGPPAGLKGADRPYVARPVETRAWADALAGEVAASRAQAEKRGAGDDPLEAGVLVVLGPGQKVLQRRLGRPPWPAFLEELGAAAKSKA